MAYEEMFEITSFGEWVRRRRNLMDLTQASLAKRVGCATVTIKKIEQDERRPSEQMAELLAEQLAVPDAIREKFIRMGRGKYVPAINTLQTSLRPPVFLQAGDRLSGSSTPLFVAREGELARLEAHLETALAGKGRVVFITGEAGSGKTTLMAEFARRSQAAQGSLIVAGGQCNAQEGIGDPYLPFRDVMSILTGDLETRWTMRDLSKENVMRLWDLLPFTIQVISEHGPDLVDLLIPGMPLLKRVAAHLPDRAGWLDQFQNLLLQGKSGEEKLEQGQLLEQATQVLRTLARQKPLLLLLDDLQWIDDASKNLLFHLGRRLSGSRILILGAYRPSEVALGRPVHGSDTAEIHPLEPLLHEFQREYGDIQIDLNQVEPAESRAFIEAYLDSEPNDLDDKFRSTLFHYTQGQPLFTVELLRDMQENGYLVQNEAGRWIQNTGWTPLTLPARVEAVIEQRLSRLDESLLELLSVACVEGERFTAQVAARILGMDERTILRRLSRDLEHRHRVVEEHGEVQTGGQTLNVYSFRHVLFQEFLYEQLSQGEKRLYHLGVGQALEEILYGGSPVPDHELPFFVDSHLVDGHELSYPDHLDDFGPALVHHFWLGGEWKKTAYYAGWMGMRAMNVYALREAIAYNERALQALSHLEEAPPEAVFDALMRWVEAAFKFRPYQEQLERLSRAEEIARGLNDTPRLILALHWKANVYLARGLWTQAGPSLMECLALAEALGNEALTVRPLYFKGLMTSFADPGAALVLLEQARVLAHRYQDLHVESLALATKGQMEAQLGEFVPSLESLQLARQISDKTDSPLTESDVDLMVAWAYLAMGDMQHVVEFSQLSLERAIATDNMDCICSSLACLGYGYLNLQRIPDALNAFEKGIERSEISGAIIPRLMSQAGLAMSRFCSGDIGAIQNLEDIMGEMQTYQNYLGAANTAQMLGTCLVQTGQLERAEEHLKAALEYYRQLNLLPYLARALFSLASLHQEQARYPEAERAREEVDALIKALNTDQASFGKMKENGSQ
jgi:transcriptional regulator with XRE-family HTH domain/tetratricopeptide (TPR) repeat protein